MRPYSKGVRKELQSLAELASDREMASALEDLHQHFMRWKRGEISPHKLNDLIHQHHNGTSRELWKIYCMDRDFIVARAVVRGVLKESELSEQLRSTIARQIESLQFILNDGEEGD
jgi:hypothetical protein